MYIYVYIYTNIYIYIYIYTHTHTYIYIYVTRPTGSVGDGVGEGRQRRRLAGWGVQTCWVGRADVLYLSLACWPFCVRCWLAVLAVRCSLACACGHATKGRGRKSRGKLPVLEIQDPRISRGLQEREQERGPVWACRPVNSSQKHSWWAYSWLPCSLLPGGAAVASVQQVGEAWCCAAWPLGNSGSLVP